MPFTQEEARTVQYMIDSYNLSKETYVFSEQNDILFRRLFSDSESTASSSKKYDYSSLDVGSLIMTVIKKNVFFVTTIDKARHSLSLLHIFTPPIPHCSPTCLAHIFCFPPLLWQWLGFSLKVSLWETRPRCSRRIWQRCVTCGEPSDSMSSQTILCGISLRRMSFKWLSRNQIAEGRQLML